jgi:hypothetical protein
MQAEAKRLGFGGCIVAVGVETAIADPSPAGASLPEQGMCRDITKTKKFACL